MKLEPIPYARPSGWSPVEKNQRTWLIALGIMSVLLGIGTTIGAIFIGAMLYLEIDSGKMPINLSDLLIAFSALLILSVVLTSVGIGSIKCQRWIRPVIVVFGIILATGAFLSFCTLSPEIFHHPRGRSFQLKDFGASVVILAAGVLTPLGCAWFYSSAPVRRTLEFYSAELGWSERCPIPIFLGCTILAMLGFTTLVHAVDRKAPAFGTFVTGPEAMVGKMIWGAMLLIGSIAMFRLWKWGWWLAILCTLTGFSSFLLTAYQLGPTPFFEVSPEMGREPNVEAPMIISAIAGTAFILYLLWLGRYFRSGVNAGHSSLAAPNPS